MGPEVPETEVVRRKRPTPKEFLYYIAGWIILFFVMLAIYSLDHSYWKIVMIILGSYIFGDLVLMIFVKLGDFSAKSRLLNYFARREVNVPFQLAFLLFLSSIFVSFLIVGGGLNYIGIFKGSAPDIVWVGTSTFVLTGALWVDFSLQYSQ